MDERQEKIRQRAHELWVAAGSPEGASEGFWLAAEKELFGESVAENQQSGKQPRHQSNSNEDRDAVTGELAWKEEIKKRTGGG